MEMLGQSPFIWLEFDKTGAIDPSSKAELSALLSKPGVTDLVVLSHGWKNDKTDATKLYGTLWGNACKQLPAGKPPHIVVAGVLWPAKAFKTDFDEKTLVQSAGGGAQAVGGDMAGPQDLTKEEFDEAIKDFKDFMDDGAVVIEKARAVAEQFDETTALHLVREGNDLVGLGQAGQDAELQADARILTNAASNAVNAKDTMDALAEPPAFNVEDTVGGAQSLGNVLTSLINGPRAAAARFLNLLTYYEMKKRAGIVGQALAKDVLSRLTVPHTVRCHLVGHSFGARLVTAAANELEPVANMPFYSLTLLQGAFSQNAFAVDFKPGVSGAFLNVVGKPAGPITITHTHNDLACTLAYAIASRLARDTTKSIGDANDIFGAMGANGPQFLRPGQAVADDTQEHFNLVAGKVCPVLADKFILKTSEVGAHNNVTNETVGKLLARVISPA